MQFSSTLYAVLTGLYLSVSSVAAVPGLSLAVSGSNSFAGIENFKIKTSLVNSGGETLKLLKDPRTILSSLPTDSFTISNDGGSSPEFTGVRVKFVPEYVIENNIEEAFVVLEPGASFELEHDLSTSYNFTDPGEGAYNIRANTQFLYIDPTTKELVELEATHEAALVATLSGTLSIDLTDRRAKKIQYVSCSDSRQSKLKTAADDAKSYASSAAAYLGSHTSATPRYESWFGKYGPVRHNKVLKHFNAIEGFGFHKDVTYDCTCDDAGVFAYVNANQYGTIYLCRAFWNAPATGSNSRAGTLVHEASHFKAVAGTEDFTYGKGPARKLAIDDPAKAIQNADSLEYFAENHPAED
ncbi:hypothetical protein PQX77_006105 [Marasmius sp. AFHP31]|nr:hypothetical protein PQX77_006105 [Marasmius sp. AFHP31]